MLNNSKQLLIALVVLFSCLITGCAGLPDHLVNEAEGFPQKLNNQQAKIDSSKSTLQKFKQGPEWTFIEPYYKSEEWNGYFTKAEKELKAALAIYNQAILPLMDKDHPQDSSRFKKAILKFKKHLGESFKAAAATKNRIKFLIDTRDNAENTYQTAKNEFANINSLYDTFKAKAKTAIHDYEHKSVDISSRIATASVKTEDAMKVFGALTNEYNNFKAGSYTNFAFLGDSAVDISTKLTDMSLFVKKNSSKLDELYQSYTKVLADQKIDYYVVIGRASWCEGEFCGSGDETKTPLIKVDEKVFEYYDSLNKDLVAKLTGGFFRKEFKLLIPRNYWSALKLPYDRNLPRDHDYAEYWVAKTVVKASHKYLTIINEETIEGDWTPVSEKLYWEHNEHLGMALVTKPYGSYEEDATKIAEPVGLAMMAKPVMVNGEPSGSNQYGEWRGGFWHYYGMYRFMGDFIGPSRHSHDEWKYYNQRDRKKPFYGNDDQYGTWGYSTYNNPIYGGSDYARSNPNTVSESRGSTKRSGKQANRSGNVTIRNAGPSSRSRGAAGGGK